MNPKLIVRLVITSIMTSSCALLNIVYPPAFTTKQCEIVEQSFDKLQVGMSKKEIISLIGGKRRVSVHFSTGKFPGEQPSKFINEQKEP